MSGNTLDKWFWFKEPLGDFCIVLGKSHMATVRFENKVPLYKREEMLRAWVRNMNGESGDTKLTWLRDIHVATERPALKRVK